VAKPLIDWTDITSHVLVNPQLPEVTKKLLNDAIRPYESMKGHIWIASSGTENFPKMIALSKQAMLISANAVNDHLQAKSDHSWLNVLPLFHVGGLGIHARAFASGSTVHDFSNEKWDPVSYRNHLENLRITYSSLTPTHVYDLVSKNLTAPKMLKAIVVGGGNLPKELHERAFGLGWPILISYGMTEVCSQIATAIDFRSDSMILPLNHVEIRFTHEDVIEIKSEALLTGYVNGNDPDKSFIDPKVDGWYATQDRGGFVKGKIVLYGRGASFIKIGGENISFSELEDVWENIKVRNQWQDDAVLIDVPDERLGHIVCLAVGSSEENVKIDFLIKEYHQQVISIAKIRRIYYLKSIPRTQLHKLRKRDLRKLIESMPFLC
jgi:o-succinylbenzoate---CoA ligase